MAWILHRDDGGSADALDARAAQVQSSAALELGGALARFGERQQARVAKMQAGHRIAEHLGEKRTLSALESFLRIQGARSFLGERGCARQELRVLLRGEAAKLIDAQEFRAALGELVVESDGIHPRNYVLAAGSWR